MDYNLMANQSHANPLGDKSMYDAWRAQARDSYLAGFRRAYESNRAPFIGNHFERWNGGYTWTRSSRPSSRSPGTTGRLVSFRQLVQWLEAQDPAVLRKLRTLNPGLAPRRLVEFLGTAASQSATASS